MRLASLLVAATVLVACGATERLPVPRADDGSPDTTNHKEPTATELASEGRIAARPQAKPHGESPGPGIHDLGIVRVRDSRIFVPDGYDPTQPTPMMLALHGANGGPQGSLNPFMNMARAHGIILVGVASRSNSWDVLYGGFGPDVRIIDRTLKHVFARYNVDEKRIGVGGFSDGASYALSLGVTNGDLFDKVVAFSPGFMVPEGSRGEPSFFITHGTDDNVLPIDRTSRELVPQLRDQGYEVIYEEFAGGHTPYPDSLDVGEWFASR